MKRTQLWIATIVLVALAVPVAAGSKADNASAASKQRKRRAAPSKAVKKPAVATPSAAVTTPSGLTYVITRKGEGRVPKTGEQVEVHYTGVLTSGLVFDSSVQRGQSFKFELGVGRVIKGWDEGVAKLRVGDQATLIIPPQLGYGAKGVGPIPPNATLIFIVELIDVKDGGPPQ